MDETLLNDTNLLLLGEMRNGEIHKIPAEKLQAVSAVFSDGLNLSAGDYIELNLRSGRPVGRHKVGNAPVETHPISVSWHFNTPGNPDVLEICRAGFSVVTQVIASRDAMQFD